MAKFLYVLFEKNSFLVSEGEWPMKKFEIYNYEDCDPSLTYVDVYDKKAKRTVKILTAKNLIESNYRNIPYISVFHRVMNNFDVNCENFRRFLKKEYQVGFFKRNSIVAIPDDSINADKRHINDFFFSCGCINEVFMANTSLLISKNGEMDYCALTKSARAIALSLVLDSGLISQAFFPNEYSDLAHINTLLDSWRMQFKKMGLSVFLHGDNIELFSQLGSVVTNDVLLKNMKAISNGI